MDSIMFDDDGDDYVDVADVLTGSLTILAVMLTYSIFASGQLSDTYQDRASQPFYQQHNAYHNPGWRDTRKTGG